MITLTNEQTEKIDLLDKLFGAISLEQLREFAESEQVVAILKGTNNNPNILKRLIQEHDIQMMDIMTMKADISVLKSDLSTLVRLVLKPYDYNSLGEAATLKSKAGVY